MRREPPQKEELCVDKQQKQTIREMREGNCGYTEIARKLDLPVNTVKSYCFRNGLNTEALNDKDDKCKCCGKIIKQKSKTRPRIFCCDACKSDWWNKHRFERKSRKITEHICPVCGLSFFDYITANRIFCSQACYRKRGEADDK